MYNIRHLKIILISVIKPPTIRLKLITKRINTYLGPQVTFIKFPEGK